MVKKPVVAIINTNEELSEYFLQRSKKQLIIFDLHQGWSGNCESVMLPTYENLLLDYDNSEERFAFVSLEIPKFSMNFMKLLNENNDATTGSGSGGVSKSSISSSGSVSKRRQRQKRRSSELNRLNLSHRGCAPLFVAIR